ncbi:MAG: transcriptional regulator with XRE-family HTH domain [Francisellaceae bacterium]
MDIAEEKKFRSQLGFEIRIIREKLGITQEQLGESLRIDSAYISKIERGIKPIPLQSLFELFAFCGEESINDLIINIINKVKNYDCYNGKNW